MFKSIKIWYFSYLNDLQYAYLGINDLIFIISSFEKKAKIQIAE
jgi:hypothetical protein